MNIKTSSLTTIDVASHLRPNLPIVPLHRSLQDNDDNGQQNSCTTQTTCDECTSQYGCHWCTNNDESYIYNRYDDEGTSAGASCHAYMSWWGCAWGQTCMSESFHKNDCMREEPEPYMEERGVFANALDTDVFAVSVGVLAFFFAGFCVWKRRKSCNLNVQEGCNGVGREGFVEMVDVDMTTNPNEKATSNAKGASAAVAGSTAAASTRLQSFASLLSIPLLVGVAVGFSTAYAPRPPILNVCSRSVDWSYVMNSFADGSIGTSFTTLFSVYNPNRYDASLLGTYGSIRHKGNEIASLYIDDITVVSRAITDVEAIVSFKTSTWEAFGILMEYYKGTLTMTFHVEFGFSVKDLNTVRVDWTSDEMSIGKYAGGGDDDNEAQDSKSVDRHLCKCQDW